MLPQQQKGRRHRVQVHNPLTYNKNIFFPGQLLQRKHSCKKEATFFFAITHREHIFEANTG